MSLQEREKKHLSVDVMLLMVRRCFEGVNWAKKKLHGRKATIGVTDCLMSGISLFGLKYPSLLQYNDGCKNEAIRHNLETIYKIKHAPSDTYMREVLDEVDPRLIRSAFTKLFAQLQRNKALEAYKFLEQYYLVSIDGSGYFSSNDVFCENCCEKNHYDGTITYHHQALAAVLVHPNCKQVITLCPEAILKQDGATKNDCELNATKRLLDDLRREHPHLKIIITSDGLSANAPLIRKLQSLNLDYIISATSGGNKSLFDFVKGAEGTEILCSDEDGNNYKIVFFNNVPLNDANPDLEVNLVDCWQTKPNGKITRFSKITGIPVTKKNAYEIIRGGRCRWKVENETFNTLKNQGYQFEHNFGHGYKHLSTVFMMLMFLAFLIDQISELTSGLFQIAVGKKGTRKAVWGAIQAIALSYFVNSWEDLLHAVAYGYKVSHLDLNST